MSSFGEAPSLNKENKFLNKKILSKYGNQSSNWETYGACCSLKMPYFLNWCNSVTVQFLVIWVGWCGRGSRERIQELLYLFSSVTVHENERRFACEECGKKFGESKVIKIFLSLPITAKKFNVNLSPFLLYERCGPEMILKSSKSGTDLLFDVILDNFKSESGHILPWQQQHTY